MGCRSSSYQGHWVTVKVTEDKRFEHSLPTDLETVLYYASVVVFFGMQVNLQNS